MANNNTLNKRNAEAKTFRKPRKRNPEIKRTCNPVKVINPEWKPNPDACRLRRTRGGRTSPPPRYLGFASNVKLPKYNRVTRRAE
jgi:hypothetical protein